MTRDDDFIGRLEGYLDEFEGMTPLPDTVRDAVRAQLPTTKRLGLRGGLLGRFPVMNNNIVRFGIAAAAVVLVAFLGIKFLPWSAIGGPTATPTATADGTPISSPSTSPAPSTTEHVSDPAFPIPLTFSVPAGWQAGSEPAGELAYTPGLGGPEIGFYVVDNLYADACQPTLGWRDPPLGPTADDLATALADLPDYAGATISTTEIDGYAAIHLDRASARSTPPCKAMDEYHTPGTALLDSVVGLLALGVYPDVWVVDVDGQRLLIVLYGVPQGFEEVDAILASLRIGR